MSTVTQSCLLANPWHCVNVAILLLLRMDTVCDDKIMYLRTSLFGTVSLWPRWGSKVENCEFGVTFYGQKIRIFFF